MIVELHIIQNFAPSNLNRDDTNAPKDCVFGGYRRGRISSQCIKRSVRQHLKIKKLVNEADLAVRTKRIVEEIARRLEPKRPNAAAAIAVAKAALGGVKLRVLEDSKTQYLLYLGNREIDQLAEICDRFWDQLLEVAEMASEKKPAKNSRDAKREGEAAVPEEVKKAVERTLASSTALDLALFGRMLADVPGHNIEAATQVAHAISTNEVNMEMDYYTAVDDLKPGDTQGADMIGVVEFNSSCFYRYSQVNLDVLTQNLGGRRELAAVAIDAYLRAAIAAVPAGKQNSMAAQNPPLYVRAIVREAGQPWSLANAFLKPIRVARDGNADLGGLSIRALEDHLKSLRRMYGEEGLLCDVTASLYDEKSSNVDALVATVLGSLPGASVNIGTSAGVPS